jgi:hypothetical protein
MKSKFLDAPCGRAKRPQRPKTPFFAVRRNCRVPLLAFPSFFPMACCRAAACFAFLHEIDA